MISRKERLLKTLRGESVDRVPVCFYELNGLDEDFSDTDTFNIYNHPSWRRLIELAADETDRIVMRQMSFRGAETDYLADLRELVNREIYYDKQGSRHIVTTIKAGGRQLRRHQRVDTGVRTTWTLEHFLKNEEDTRAFLALPEKDFAGIADVSSIEAAEARLGDSGMVMIDIPDALCLAAELFDMSTFTIIALTESNLFSALLHRFQRFLLPRVQVFGQGCPGRLWRIYGPEYACRPYLPPALFAEYVLKYDRELVEAIHSGGGWARIHAHGMVRDILDGVVEAGFDAIDPLEPAPQGDVQLSYVRQRYGKNLVLFGNLELSDLTNLSPKAFAVKIRRALEEGTSREGRGFVLMPSACPYGREISDNVFENYRLMTEMARDFG